MKEIIDQYSPLLEGKVNVADVKKKQKQIRLKPATTKATESLKPLKQVTADPDSTSTSS